MTDTLDKTEWKRFNAERDARIAKLNERHGHPDKEDDSVTLTFECGCRYSVFDIDGRLLAVLACCKTHEAPYRQLKDILPLTLKGIK